jgi:phage terminase large subunit GpA-like protein
MPDGLTKQALALWKPPPRLSLSEWADEHAVLSAESAAEPGRWRTLPYQRGILDAFSDPTVEIVTCLKSARIGWTKILNHVIGYHIHQDPCPIMVVQPAVEDAEGYSKDEIAPMLRDTPALRGLVADAKQKDGSNTILVKQYAGGTLQMVGANSGRGFRRTSRRVVLFDEASAYRPISEGDQIKLGMQRSAYYWNRKIGIGSTPIIKGFDKTEAWFLRSDQRRYFVPCPECGHMQVLRWGQMKWEKYSDGIGLPETAVYECENCGHLIPHSRKRWMVERGEWRATAEAQQPGLVGFHIWAGYSYSPNASWAQLVREFLEVKGDREQLQTFVNTVLGEPFEDEFASKVSADALHARALAEGYRDGECPPGVLLLLMSVDVQDTWLEMSVWGVGRGEEMWLIWHQKSDGDPAQEDVWEQVDAVRRTDWVRADGGTLRVFLCGVDTGGHFTGEAYNYCRERVKEGVVALKGSNRRGSPPINKGAKQDVTWRGKTIRQGVTLYQVGTDGLKNTIHSRLRNCDAGPGAFHFGLSGTMEYMQGLTCEKQVVRYVKGYAVREWVKTSGARNEPLDLLVYCLSLLHLAYRKFNRVKMWDQLAANLTLAQPKLPSTAAVESSVKDNGKRKGGWIDRDRGRRGGWL